MLNNIKFSDYAKFLSLLVLLGLSISHSFTVMASTWDEIKELDAKKGIHPTTDLPPAPPAKRVVPARWHTLSDGQRVNLANWKLVLFMQSTCQYCHRFDPLVKQYSESIGIGVFAFSLDGQGDDSYPGAVPATPDVMVQYFAPGMPIATPTTFLTNVNTMATYPLVQGAIDANAFAGRLDEVFRIALRGGQK
ncbi:type-F conjugative transfer system pilin assembly thiol-disulfide isomerase TrbB [Serratia liquefaciens]|uniref:type-F conjugative transfer system pilin assembly thiol-disulfide isomerase TrbB n=1 Tax=Serratia liquefaciens TaxID=614 RepID=UPI0032DE5F5A